jgi:outer membrane protein assembly factor BamB
MPTRVAAADALGRMGSNAVPAIRPMLAATTNAETWASVALLDGIKAMGPAAHEMVLNVWERRNDALRIPAGWVVWSFGAEMSNAVPRIKKLLDDPNPEVRKMAAITLERIEEEMQSGPVVGSAAKGVVPPAFANRAMAPLKPNAATADWPGFRGPDRDGLCAETGLSKQWPEAGPKLLWQMNGLGRGFSSVSIVGGKLFTMGDRAAAGSERAQFVLAFDLASRRELWSARIGPAEEDGPRCTPTVDGGLLYALGTDGHLMCLETATGVVRWQKHLVSGFGGRMMSVWKFCESPLVDGDKLICTPGGEQVALVALDKRNGNVLWKSVVPSLGPRGKDGAAYASPMVAEIEGLRQYVQVLGRGVVGVAADTGQFLWGYNRAMNDVANVPNPLIRENQVFVSNSYGAGSALLRIRREGDSFKADEVYFLKAKEFENHHGGMVLVGDYVYGGAGLNKGDPTCINFATGQIAWKEKAPSNGSAAVLYADGLVWFRYDRGPVVAVAADPKAFRVVAQFKPLTADGPAYAYPVIHNRRLYLRHNDLLACYDLTAQP